MKTRWPCLLLVALVMVQLPEVGAQVPDPGPVTALWAGDESVLAARGSQMIMYEWVGEELVPVRVRDLEHSIERIVACNLSFVAAGPTGITRVDHFLSPEWTLAGSGFTDVACVDETVAVSHGTNIDLYTDSGILIGSHQARDLVFSLASLGGNFLIGDPELGLLHPQNMSFVDGPGAEHYFHDLAVLDQFIAGATGDRRLVLLGINAPAQIMEWANSSMNVIETIYPARDVAVAAEGSAVALTDGSVIHLLDPNTGSTYRSIETGSTITDLSSSAGGTWVLTGHDDGTVQKYWVTGSPTNEPPVLTVDQLTAVAGPTRLEGTVMDDRHSVTGVEARFGNDTNWTPASLLEWFGDLVTWDLWFNAAVYPVNTSLDIEVRASDGTQYSEISRLEVMVHADNGASAVMIVDFRPVVGHPEVLQDDFDRVNPEDLLWIDLEVNNTGHVYENLNYIVMMNRGTQTDLFISSDVSVDPGRDSYLIAVPTQNLYSATYDLFFQTGEFGGEWRIEVFGGPSPPPPVTDPDPSDNDTGGFVGTSAAAVTGTTGVLVLILLLVAVLIVVISRAKNAESHSAPSNNQKPQRNPTHAIWTFPVLKKVETVLKMEHLQAQLNRLRKNQ